jgi:hypothetical protein
MWARKQRRGTKTGVTQGSFFQEQLKGEEALSRTTAEQLYAETTEFMEERPWEFLADEELILVDDPESGERCYCCVMGAAGEWTGMHAYQGEASYRVYRSLASGHRPDPYSFYEKQKGVSLEIVRASDLEAADQVLLKAFDHPLKKGMLAPQFRAVRPGYLPWHVTEAEGRLLRHCLCAVNIFCAMATDEELEGFWREKDVYLLVVQERPDQEYKVRLVTAPAPGPAPLEVADLDEERIRRIAAEYKKSETILEAEHFFAPGTIGQKNERKMCMHLTLVADAKSGFLYHSEFGMPGESRAVTVNRALLAAMESAHSMPAEVLVKETALTISLAGLGSALGFKVRAVKNLPATQEAREFLFETFIKRKRGS